MEIAVGTKASSTPGGTREAHVAEVVGPGSVLLAVAEGFGPAGGEPAPALAVAALRDALRRRLRPDGRDARAALLAAFSNANARIFATSGSDDDHVVSGTSLSAALIVGDRAHIAHVGCTRVALGRDGSLTSLTVDDELDRGIWAAPRSSAPTGALTGGHLLTRTLGTQATLDATVSIVRLGAGDALILATSAFRDALADSEIAYALAAGETSEAIAQQFLGPAAGRREPAGGTVIVGRALTAPAEPVAARGRSALRAATVALAVLVILSFLASTVLHALLGP